MFFPAYTDKSKKGRTLFDKKIAILIQEVEVIKATNFAEKCSLFTPVLLVICLIFPYSILRSECECPYPIEYNGQAQCGAISPNAVYVSPGANVSVDVHITNEVSPICNPEDTWSYGPLFINYYTPPRGSGWAWLIPEDCSDCRSQNLQIQVPFDNDDTDSVWARYEHGRAGSMDIFVIPYSDPDPDKTDDMDAVNTYTGAFHISDGDYSNSDLEFKRYYNNMALVGTYVADTLRRWTNPIGIGWQHNYNIYLEEIRQIDGVTHDTVDACSIHEGKSTNIYKLLANGKYQPRSGNHSNLKKSGSIWKLYKPDGNIYYFGSSGKADSIVDRNGRKTEFTYSGNYLSQVQGKDNHTLNLSYNSDSLLRWVSITENNNTKKFEYRYSPVTLVMHADSDTFDLMGVYYLAQVLQHYPSGSTDSLMSLHKYYYDNKNLKMVAKVFHQDLYSQSDTVWEGNYKKGDRVYIWYDSTGQTVYNEIIEGDADTLLTNDKVTYRAYTKYFRRTAGNRGMDSTWTYIYQAIAGTGSAHSPYDTTFTPQAPASDYAIRKRKYHNDVIGRQIFIETIPDSGASFESKYYKDKDFNDTLSICSEDDTTEYFYQTYILNNDTIPSPNPVKIIYPNGDSSLFYYHAPDTNAPSFFLIDSTFDELSRKTEYYYDTNYNLDSLRYFHRYVSGVGTTNVTTDYTYNSKGNLTQLKDPRGNSTHFQYAPNDTGAYLTETWIDFSHTGGGQPGNADIVTKYKYNADIGKVDTIIYYRDYPSDSSIVRYVYDVMNRLKETYYPDGTYDIFTYDKRGNLLKKEIGKTGTETKYFKIAYEYDAMDHLTKVKEYKTALSDNYDSTFYKYNLDGDLIGFINANDTTGTSTEVKYSYDADRLLKVEYPDTTTDSLGYFKDGNLMFKRDRKGKVVAYVYDDRNRLTRKRYFNSFAAYESPDSTPAETLAFSYDKVGNMVSMLDKNGTVSYSYDEMDRIDTLSSYGDILITYEYDVGGNRKRLKLVNESTPAAVYLNQGYPTYDEANRLEKTITGTDTFDFNYWDTGQIKKIEYPNGVKEQYKLTSRNFIDIVTDSSGNYQLFKSDYKYNEVGDRDSLIFKLTRPGEVAPITGTITYKYDDLRRLTEAKYPRSIYNKTNKYTYDKAGNRKRKIAGIDTTDYTYNKRNNQLNITDEPDTFSYDDNGNLTTHKLYPGPRDWTLTYDFENRATRILKKTTGLPTIYDTLWFNYCGQGKRISKIEKPNGGSPDTTSYAFDGMYAVCEFGGHLDLQYKYIYANGLLLARYDASPADTHYYHHDGLGSIMGMTNESGNVEQSYFYDEFGNSLGSWGSVSNHYLYTGQEYDGSITGLYNLRARYYDRSIGRFVSEDPILQIGLQNFNSYCTFKTKPTVNRIEYAQMFPQIMNKYDYVCNNPINYDDITGKQSKWMHCCFEMAYCFRELCYEVGHDPKFCEKLFTGYYIECLGNEKISGELPPDPLPGCTKEREVYCPFAEPPTGMPRP